MSYILYKQEGAMSYILYIGVAGLRDYLYKGSVSSTLLRIFEINNLFHGCANEPTGVVMKIRVFVPCFIKETSFCKP